MYLSPIVSLSPSNSTSGPDHPRTCQCLGTPASTPKVTLSWWHRVLTSPYSPRDHSTLNLEFLYKVFNYCNEYSNDVLNLEQSN